MKMNMRTHAKAIGKQSLGMHVTWVSQGLFLLFVWQAALAQEAIASKNWLNGLWRTVVEFEVVDEEGNPVPDADASVVFVKNDSLYNAKGDHGRTDADGRLAMGGFSTGEVIFHFGKDGYYRTSGRVWFQRQGHVADGVCWEQDKLYGQNYWPEEGQTGVCRKMLCRVVMKKTMAPHPMRAFDVDAAWPDDLERLGFDLEECDWVAPRGQGKHADLWFAKTSEKPGNTGGQCVCLEMLFGDPESGNGYICLERDYWSERGWLSVAPETGYEGKLTVSCNGTLANELAMGEKYLVVRTRVKWDEKGHIVSARYGLFRLVRLVPGKAGLAPASVCFFGWMNMQDNELSLENTPVPFVDGKSIP